MGTRDSLTLGRNDRDELAFDLACRRCPRLAAFLAEQRSEYPSYHNAPVPAFGDQRAPLLVVGLAPGLHGANRSGRPFTGDHAGILLYRTLHQLGFASAPLSVAANDDLRLSDLRITNAVKCVPPGNKPTTAEIRECNGFLSAELSLLQPRIVVALGRIAHEAVLRACGLPLTSHRFAHAAEHRVESDLGAFWLIDSFHCSRYNTNTGRLTDAMFESVFLRARDLLKVNSVAGKGTELRWG
ncbi:MAG: uracil-DNA glycosylase [Thioalkalivibrionaceae bacterium]